MHKYIHPSGQETWQGFVVQSCGLASHAVCQIQEPVFYIVFFFRYFNRFLNDYTSRKNDRKIVRHSDRKTKRLYSHYLIPVIPKTWQETWQESVSVRVSIEKTEQECSLTLSLSLCFVVPSLLHFVSQGNSDLETELFIMVSPGNLNTFSQLRDLVEG